MLAIFVQDALVQGTHLSEVPKPAHRLDQNPAFVSLSGLLLADVGDSRHHFSPKSDSFTEMVLGDLVDGDFQEGKLRFESSKAAGIGKLSSGVALGA